MQQRAKAEDALDDFPTAPWATRAYIHHVLSPAAIRAQLTINRRSGLPPAWRSAWEPCCNRGYMALPLREAFSAVLATDVHDYGWDGMDQKADFLFPGPAPITPDWIFMNPPFLLAEAFIAKALATAAVGVAVFVRTSFLEGQDRFHDLWNVTPPTMIHQFSERVVLHKGILRDPDKLYWNPTAKDPKTGKKTGRMQKPTTATSYCWITWMRDQPRQPFSWIPPCRLAMTRPGDYPLVDSPASGA